ncbi:hypothetical protein [Paractinoplanes durhamensis]|uniref:hypothetical protein n=1 Tax=Paractinoplanes durhamensis TaxID=113563 RepID=UPI003632E603
MTALAVEDLRIRFGDTVAVDGLSFELPAGERSASSGNPARARVPPRSPCSACTPAPSSRAGSASTAST